MSDALWGLLVGCGAIAFVLFGFFYALYLEFTERERDRKDEE
jgi:hypothetical protein